MTIERSQDLFYNYCRSKQLRPKTMQTYRQGLQLFSAWLRKQGIGEVTEIREMTIREYILSLQERGKYAVLADERTRESTCGAAGLRRRFHHILSATILPSAA